MVTLLEFSTLKQALGKEIPFLPTSSSFVLNFFLGSLLIAGKQGQIHGISIANNAPSITHLLYADDSLLFCEANPEEAMIINNIFFPNTSSCLVKR